METAELVKWEYKTLRLEIKETSKGFLGTSYFQDIEEISKVDISQFGEEGWEMISVMPIHPPGVISGTSNAVAFFKRPKSDIG